MGAFRLGGPELIIILVIVLLLFGPGRISKIAGELGRGIRSFKDGINPDDDNEAEETEEKKTEDE
jgi:sec-independent protein translocase protein TatA